MKAASHFTTRLLTFALAVVLSAAVTFHGTALLAQPYAGGAGNYGPGPYDRPGPPAPTTTGVRWESNPSLPLTADAPSDYRTAAVEQYRLAQRPASPAGPAAASGSPAPGASSVFEAPPVPGGRRFPTAPDMPAESPFAPPPPPSGGHPLPPRETWPPPPAAPRPDSRPEPLPPHPPVRQPGIHSPDRGGPRPWPPQPDPSQPPIGESYPTDRFADTHQDLAAQSPGGVMPPRSYDERPGGTTSPPPRPAPPPIRDSSVGRDATLRGNGQRFDVARSELPGPRPPIEAAGERQNRTLPTAHAPHNMLGSFEPAKLLALVGNQPVLVGDLMPQINQFLQANADKIPPGAFEENKDRWLKMVLEQSIDTKLAFVDFLRTIPPERLEFVQGKINEQFDETELPKAMQKAEVKTPAELDAKLREFGSSLEKQRRMFAEQILAHEMIRQHVKRDKEVTHQEMLDYYREHEDEFQVEARARWEHLCARFSECPDKDSAWRTTVDMGNEVLRGAPLEAVARRSSQGLDAEDGGMNDWTTKDSLRSETLNEAIFSLPLNRMSEIIEDEDGFHIIRVIEREPAGLVPFVDAQVKIKEAIQRQRFEEQKTAYLKGLREKTTIWTAYDNEPTDVSARPGGEGSR